MRKHVTYTILAAGATIAALPALGQLEAPPAPPAAPAAPQQDAARTFNPVAKYSVGDLLKYKMNMIMSTEVTTPGGPSPMPATTANTTASVRMKTAGVKPDGTAVIVVTTDDAKVTVNGAEQSTPPSPPITMEVDKLGMSKLRGLENVPGGQVMGQFMNTKNLPSIGAILPDHPIKIGDTWNSELPSPFGDAKYRVVSTLLGVETVGNQETLKIKQDLSLPVEIGIGADQMPVKDLQQAMVVLSGQATGTTVINILESNGRMLKTIGDVNIDLRIALKGEAAKQSPIGDSMNMKMGMKMKMDLLSAGKVPPAPAKQPAQKPSGKG